MSTRSTPIGVLTPPPGEYPEYPLLGVPLYLVVEVELVDVALVHEELHEQRALNRRSKPHSSAGVLGGYSGYSGVLLGVLGGYSNKHSHKS